MGKKLINCVMLGPKIGNILVHSTEKLDEQSLYGSR